MSREAIRAKETPVIEKVLVKNLADLTEEEKIEYYKAFCESVGLNPLTKPLEYVELDGKLTLYAKRDCTDQLRKSHNVSIKILGRELDDGVYAVRAQAEMPNGRVDEAIGAVPFIKEDGKWEWNDRTKKKYFNGTGIMVPISPSDRALGKMKAETKAKRRVTLSICGLGLLDESELEDAVFVHARNEESTTEQHSVADKKAEADPGLRIVPKSKPTPPVVEKIKEEEPKPADEPPAQDEPPRGADSVEITDDDLPTATPDPPAETPEQKAQRELREHVARLIPTLDNIQNIQCSKFVSAFTGSMKGVPEVERCKQWGHALSVLEEELHQHPAEVNLLRENPAKYAATVKERAEKL